MNTIKLTKGYETILDEDDYVKYKNYSYWACVKSSGIYAVRTQRYGPRSQNKSKKIYLHREIMNAGPNDVIDHINRNTLDNRKSNLRFCTRAQNAVNSNGNPSKRKYSKYKGVKKNRNCSTWSARIKNTYLGSFLTEEEAAQAYDNAAKTLYGEFAKLNYEN